MTKSVKNICVSFDGDHAHVNVPEGIDVSWMVRGKYYPTQFANVEGSHWAYINLFVRRTDADGSEFLNLGLHYQNKAEWSRIPDEKIDNSIVVDLTFTNKIVPTWCKDKVYDDVKLLDMVEGLKTVPLDAQGRQHHPIDVSNAITLDNGKSLIKDYGKYNSGLCFICDIPYIDWKSIDRQSLNFASGDFSCLYGMYYKSKKGTDCFKVMPKSVAPHILLRDNWGGCFNSYRGYTLEEDKAKYYRRASSHGGGTGYDYAVFDKDFRNVMSEDDI